MRSLPGFVFSAAAMLMTGAAIVPAEPAQAAVSFNLNFGFNYFHDRLADRGRWVSSPIWGDVWQPGRRFVGADFQPYTNGYWEYTDEYGWYWVSDDPFDDVVYHYGRWVYDPDMSWVWIPGYTWGPGWVVWREGDGYSGWLPMPPDEAFVSGSGLSLGMNFGSSGVELLRLQQMVRQSRRSGPLLGVRRQPQSREPRLSPVRRAARAREGPRSPTRATSRNSRS